MIRKPDPRTILAGLNQATVGYRPIRGQINEGPGARSENRAAATDTYLLPCTDGYTDRMHGLGPGLIASSTAATASDDPNSY